MMLNSVNNYKGLILALVCSSISYSTFAKVYSWRDADGAMHYSQFPRQIVEKNAAQSRASRKQADINDVVNDVSEAKASNLLDGLDDIVANANAERQVEKVLSRRDPQLVLIEQQLARQQAEQRALVIAKQETLEKQQLAAANLYTTKNTTLNNAKSKQKAANSSFMAGIHKRAYGNSSVKTTTLPAAASTTATSNAILSTTVASSQLASTSTANSIKTVDVKQKRKPVNSFLAEIQNKLKRNNKVKSKPISSTSQSVVIANADSHATVNSNAAVNSNTLVNAKAAAPQADAGYILDPIEPMIISSPMLAVDTPLLVVDMPRQVVETSQLEQTAVIAKAPAKKLAKANNPFLAGIKKKLNRKTPVVDQPVVIASQNKVVHTTKAQVTPGRSTPEVAQNKFLAEINKKLFRARLGPDTNQAAELVKSAPPADTNNTSAAAAKNKDLTQSADQIKAIEDEINSSKLNKAKSPSEKQINSTLMLSRLSYNKSARLPLSGAGTNQLDRQGLEASSQFVNDVNRTAE